MAGHSHSANIAVRKGKQDAARAKLFSKLSRYIIIAARAGGGDPDTNLKLRYAIDKARAVSMPRDNIERAIKRGTGELDGASHGGTGLRGLRPRRRRRHLRHPDRQPQPYRAARSARSSIAAAGTWAVRARFPTCSIARASSSSRRSGRTEDALMNVVLEAGAEDLTRDGDKFEVTCEVTAFNAVQSALEKAGIKPESAEIEQVPKAMVDVDMETGRKVARLLDALDEHDDVQTVFSNAKLTAEMFSE